MQFFLVEPIKNFWYVFMGCEREKMIEMVFAIHRHIDFHSSSSYVTIEFQKKSISR